MNNWEYDIIKKNDCLILGIDITDWVGWMDEDEYHNDFCFRYKEYMEQSPDVNYVIIYDSLNEDYYFFGKILGKRLDTNPDIKVITEDEFSLAEKMKLVAEANRIFGKDYTYRDVKLYYIPDYKIGGVRWSSC